MEQESIAKQALQPDDFETMFLAGLAVDAVIFGFHKKQLKILLLKYENTNLYALPGGFIKKDENLNEAAKRTVSERTGLQDVYLEQFYVFGDVARHDPTPMQTIMEGKGFAAVENHWLLKRFLTVGYYALVDYTKAVPAPDLLADKCEWHSMDDLPSLMLDHSAIVEKALQVLRSNLDQKLIAFNLLPPQFTMGDLQDLYETILNEKLLRTSFQRKMLHIGMLEKVDKKFAGGAHKAPYLYKFIKKSQ